MESRFSLHANNNEYCTYVDVICSYINADVHVCVVGIDRHASMLSKMTQKLKGYFMRAIAIKYNL